MSLNRVWNGLGESVTETGKAIGVVAESAGHLHPANHEHFMHSLAAITLVGVLFALGGWVLVPGVTLAQIVAAGITASLAMTVMTWAASMRYAKG